VKYIYGTFLSPFGQSHNSLNKLSLALAVDLKAKYQTLPFQFTFQAPFRAIIWLSAVICIVMYTASLSRRHLLIGPRHWRRAQRVGAKP